MAPRLCYALGQRQTEEQRGMDHPDVVPVLKILANIYKIQANHRTPMTSPNILFVFSDQQRYSALGANGNDVVKTPFLDGLASEGMACDRMFSNHPLCSPYRAILLTGQYGWRNGVIDNEYRPRRDIPTLPGVLREHGYGTGHVGTFHLGKGPYFEEDRYGLDYLAAVQAGRGYFDVSYYENETGPTEFKGWGPEVEADLAIRFMERHLENRPDDPFALFVSWRPPHWPYKRYPEEHAIYDTAEVDLPGNVPEQMAYFARREIADYYGCCTGLDAQMGRLLGALDRLGIRENTIVCYTSDHGDHLSSHGYGKPSDQWLHHSMRASQGHTLRRIYSCALYRPVAGEHPSGFTDGRFLRCDRHRAEPPGRVRCICSRGTSRTRRLLRMAGSRVTSRSRSGSGRLGIRLSHEHGEWLAKSDRLGRSLEGSSDRALHLRPLVRKRARPLAVRSAGRSSRDDQRCGLR